MYVCAHAYERAHYRTRIVVCTDGGAATATRQQHNAANTGADKIGIRTAMSRTPAGTHAFFARNLPTVVRTYICYLPASPSPYLPLFLYLRGSLLLLGRTRPFPSFSQFRKRDRDRKERAANAESLPTGHLLRSVVPFPSCALPLSSSRAHAP